jgi:hypothetical protein
MKFVQAPLLLSSLTLVLSSKGMVAWTLYVIRIDGTTNHQSYVSAHQSRLLLRVLGRTFFILCFRMVCLRYVRVGLASRMGAYYVRLLPPTLYWHLIPRLRIHLMTCQLLSIVNSKYLCRKFPNSSTL